MNNSSRSRAILVVVAAIAFLLVGVYGYSRGVISETHKNVYQQSPAPPSQVLGETVRDEYINPFTLNSGDGVLYPIEQLRGCRNRAECFTVCTQPENFQRCSAWNKSL